MRTVGIIAEYNPFHTGHEYHIRKAKELSGADFAVVVMSPDYVQRGAPAIFDKYTRAEMALRCGADLVIELPVCYATGSAEYFAEGAVRMLDGLGVVDTLCFGVETVGDTGSSSMPAAADVRMYQKAAQILTDEPEPYQHALRKNLRLGLTFPRARAEALNTYMGMGDHFSGISDLLSSPNNILGVEYCKALRKLRSGITPLPLLRRGNSYSDLSLNGDFCSASAIRNSMEEKDTRQMERYIPENIHSLFSEACAGPLFWNDFLPILMQKLIYIEHPEQIFDLSKDLSERIFRLRYQCVGKSFREITARLKTKQITEARIRRVLLHLILDIRKDTVESFQRDGGIFYEHILGFCQNAAPLLHEIKQKSVFPLISKAARASRQISETGLVMWSQDLAASHLYRAIRAERYGLPFKSEQEISPINMPKEILYKTKERVYNQYVKV